MATGERTRQKKLHQSWRRSLPLLMGSGGEQAAHITARASLGQVGQTSGRSDTVKDKPCPWINNCVMPSSLPHSVVCFGFGQRLKVSLKAQDEELLQKQALKVTLLVSYGYTERSLEKRKTQALHLDLLWVFLKWQGQAAHRNMKGSTGAPCSEAGHCWVQQLGSVPVLQHSKEMIPCLCVFLGNWRDRSPTWKPVAISGMQGKLSVDHEKDFFCV